MTDPTFIPNLAPNANPVTPLLVHLVEKAKPAGLTRYRLRDAYIHLDDRAGPFVAIFVGLGGDHRGGANAPLWNQVRQHPLYARDEDSTIDGHATIYFRVPRAVAWTAQRAAKCVPLLATSPEDKQRDAIDVQMGRPTPNRMPVVTEQHVKLTLVGLAAAVETWDPSRG